MPPTGPPPEAPGMPGPGSAPAPASNEPAQLPVLDPFLSQTATNPATPNQATWVPQIFDDQNLTVDAQVNVQNQDGETSYSNIVVTWKPGNGSGDYQFSSERNSAYFLGQVTGIADVKNTSWVGDTRKSGVMLLRTGPASAELKNVVLPAMSVKLDEHESFGKLLSVIDKAGVLVANLKPPHDWVSTGGVLDRPMHLPIDGNVRNRKRINGLWCSAEDMRYDLVMSLTYNLQLKPGDIGKWLSDNFGGFKANSLTNSDPQAEVLAELTVTKIALYTSESLKATKGPKGIYQTTLSLAIPVPDFVIHIDFRGPSMKVLLVPTGTGNISAMINNAFGGSRNTGDVSTLPNGQGSADTSIFSKFDGVHPWYIGLTIPFNGPKIPGSSSPADAVVDWEFGLLALWTIRNQNLILAFSYDSHTKHFVGQTVLAEMVPTSNKTRQLGYDPRFDLIAALNTRGVTPGIPTELDILALVGLNTDSSPIAPKLTAARVSYGAGEIGNSTLFTMYGKCNIGAINDPLIPPVLLNTASIDVQVLKTGNDTLTTLVASDICTITGQLTNAEQQQNPKQTPPSALIAVRLAFTSFQQQQSWSLRATAKNLSVGLIRSFFDSEAQSGALAVIDKIKLASIDVNYTFTGKTASAFSLKGALVLGGLELDLVYNRTQSNTQSNWTFEAVLGANSPSSTIGLIAESIVPGAQAKIPEFVGGIEIQKVDTNAIPVLKLQSDTNAAKGGTATLLTVWITIAGFSLTFVQYRTRPSGVVKRILRISVDQIPSLDKIPLVGKMPQPFDHLEYLWVEDDNASATPPVASAKLGLSKVEVDDISSLLPKYIYPFQLKEAKGSGPEIALAIGHHFVVIVSGKVILDHVFSTTQEESKGSNGSLSGTSNLIKPGFAPVTPTPSIPDAQPTKGSTKISAGPLSINALTFQYKSAHLQISIDATLDLGAMTFSVIGFVIDIDLRQVKLNHLADIVLNKLITAELHGLELGLTQGPLTLQGVFIHDKGANYESYRGGVAVGFKAWQVLAVGEYMVHLKPDYKAVFMYGKLDGPLVELAFATISGVRVGFGYNYAVRMPDLTELTTFPLINDSGLKGAGGSPSKILEAVRGGPKPFVYIKQGSSWFAAGMTITAFEVLTLTAVLILSIEATTDNKSGVDIAMFADGIFQMPPHASPDLSLFYIELVVKVELNFANGFIAADAALAPSSHILVPAARLVGSASFYNWFGNNTHAGDWVVSIGGYARDYQIPLHYPKPSRIGLQFTVGDNIQMLGTAYTAVTPKCAMAGGSLHMTLSVGPVSAYADIIFDAYINFEPFHFRASLSVVIGVACQIDILFVHCRVSVQVGADIVVWGPNEFGGRAHVDFWFFAFGISFGADEDSEAMKAIPLSQFAEMVTKPGPEHDKSETDTVGATGDPKALHKYSVEDGLFYKGSPPPAESNGDFPSTGALTVFKVLGGTLKLRIDCGFALSEAKLTLPKPPGSKENDPIPSPQSILLPGGGNAPPVYSWPMHTTNGQSLSSSLTVTIKQIIDDHTQPVQGNFRAELVTKTASSAMWSQWDPSRDPLFSDKTPESLKNGDGGVITLVQGVRILPPLPTRAQSKIIEFNAAAAMKFTVPASLSLPTREDQSTKYGPLYFEDKDSSGNPVDGPTRWADFKKLWVPPNPPDQAVKDIADLRKEVVTQIAQVLEWWIRPPEQMAKNNLAPPPPDAGALPQDPVPNAPRLLESGRTDWQLNDAQPKKMVDMLNVYYPALPCVCV